MSLPHTSSIAVLTAFDNVGEAFRKMKPYVVPEKDKSEWRSRAHQWYEQYEHKKDDWNTFLISDAGLAIISFDLFLQDNQHLK